MGEEAGAGYEHAPIVVCKGKRSKRQRVHAAPPPPPPEVVIAAGAESSISAADDGRHGAEEEEEAASGCVTEEDEDMALCLMFLACSAQAGPSSLVAVAPGKEKEEGRFRSRRPADGGAGEFVYECRTCGRCFPSFQALGGHRTSHKKPRLLLPTPDEKTRPPPTVAEQNTPTVLAILAVPATPPKHEAAVATAIGGSKWQQQQGRVHECGVCGAEFASGQALGGHMRRHRPLVPASATDVGAVASSGKEKCLLELDLNMPAPCDDAAEMTSPAFGVKEMFPAPAPALVHCRY